MRLWGNILVEMEDGIIFAQVNLITSIKIKNVLIFASAILILENVL